MFCNAVADIYYRSAVTKIGFNIFGRVIFLILAMCTNTPDYSHIREEDLQHIYDPAEDTFLLLDALEKEVHLLKEIR